MASTKKTIEIDDSGTGDLVGDAFIGFHVIESGELLFKRVPVQLYRKNNIKNNAPKKKILEIVKQVLNELNYKKGTDVIKLCRGDCFDLVRDYFEEQGIRYEDAAIEGVLQLAVEGRLIQHLRNLGVRSRSLTIESGAKRYFVLFDWVARKFPQREKYVKSGFKGWQKKWKKIAIDKYEKYQKKRR
ncbi:MAG: hypothetical protein GF311_24365 [Candidatus Lokiarchaeota archaeon]|nr:hypothetical protein [Candidatus Lokiarchaeota archaeon]